MARRSERVELPERPGAREAAYRFASLDYPATERRFNCYYAEFQAVALEKLRPHDHAGVEFTYVTQGTLSVHMNAEEHVLEAGDAIYFDSTVPHPYRRRGGPAVRRSCRDSGVSGCITSEHRHQARPLA